MVFHKCLMNPDSVFSFRDSISAYFLLSSKSPDEENLASCSGLLLTLFLYVMPHSFVFTVISPLFFKCMHYQLFISSLLVNFIYLIYILCSDFHESTQHLKTMKSRTYPWQEAIPPLTHTSVISCASVVLLASFFWCQCGCTMQMLLLAASTLIREGSGWDWKISPSQKCHFLFTLHRPEMVASELLTSRETEINTVYQKRGGYCNVWLW